MAKKPRIPHKFHPWINARKQFRLSDAHIQMARELGLSPKRFAKYADRENQPWKLPLTEFIEAQYLKQFGKDRPDEVKTMEEIAAAHVAKRAARKLANANRTSDSESDPAEAANNAATKTDWFFNSYFKIYIFYSLYVYRYHWYIKLFNELTWYSGRKGLMLKKIRQNSL